ncbi:HAMP domain-containing protein [Pseudomaricurvus alcaniphilus]|uniref:ATP-binding protein n=1 Tax=Pseudomaricurvus alcaniphilus TaxID=1166482 RepID=UPI00140C072F|nr:HAMP domain-containing protein [Pseudomaricurvus alcaniphilus]
MPFISRTYVKIFLVFWLVTILTLLGSNLIVHFLGLGPDKHISHSESDRQGGAGGRLLREIVSDAVNYDYHTVKEGLQRMPAWASRYFYIIDDNGNDLLDRDIPASVKQFLPQINSSAPSLRSIQGQDSMFGRHFTLSDGAQLRLVVISPHDAFLRWMLYFNNFWHILLLSVIISGAACFYLARFITRDIQKLKEATQQIARGNWDTRVAEEFCNRPGEMAELGRAFDNMVVKLQRTMEEQRRLIKDVSHELRTPLARLQVALAIAQQRANSEITGELDRIKRSADYLNDVISNILSLPLTDQDSWELDDVVEICSLVSVIIEVSESDLKTKNISLIRKDDLKEALIQTRSTTLASVFDNVLRNAIRYTPQNSTINVCMSRTANGYCRITIADRGPGIDPKHLDAIFEPFFRTDEARCRTKGGYGLGLAIAKRTVELHGGTIKAEINRAGGLSVIITLPLCDENIALMGDDNEEFTDQDTPGHRRS